jgi:hypothetical protein
LHPRSSAFWRLQAPASPWVLFVAPVASLHVCACVATTFTLPNASVGSKCRKVHSWQLPPGFCEASKKVLAVCTLWLGVGPEPVQR